MKSSGILPGIEFTEAAMSESIRTRFMRWGFNLFPAYRGSGARITYIADDLKQVRIRLRLNWRTRNYVGTIFGGSMYAAVDPVYMVMLIELLGPEYRIWDKGARIDFVKPGRSTLYGTFEIDQQEIEQIRSELASTPKLERIYRVDLVDKNGKLHASCEKTLHIRKKDTDPPTDAPRSNGSP